MGMRKRSCAIQPRHAWRHRKHQTDCKELFLTNKIEPNNEETKITHQYVRRRIFARPNGELDWMTSDQDDKLTDFIHYLIDSSDTILLGRKMAGDFVNYWENVVNNEPNHPHFLLAKKMVDTPKVVFTKTLDKSTWNNTALAKGNLAEEIANLKKQNGKDIIVYGGAGFVSSLIKEGLIYEYHFFLNPTAIGNGINIF